MTNLDTIFAAYGELLAEVDRWFGDVQARFPEKVACGKGCSDCCRGLFDITLLDALYLRHGFLQLPEASREVVLARARERLTRIQDIWPDFGPPYLLNLRPDEEWEALMPEDDETPCVLLSDDATCLCYDHRPMTCRLYGLPLIDLDGEPFHDDWCTINFADVDITAADELRYLWRELFQRELSVFNMFTNKLLGQSLNELDTFIPLALLPELASFTWPTFLEQFHLPTADLSL